MPYSVRFTRPILSPGREPYINDCCIGGDHVLTQLLPVIEELAGRPQEPTQEDWGWFVWFDHGGLEFAVDVFTHDHLAGEFELHLTSRRPRFLRSAVVTDVSELERLRDRVVGVLQRWPVRDLHSEQLDANYR